MVSAACVSSNKRQVFKKGFARQHFEILPFQSVDLHRRGNWIYNGDLAATLAAYLHSSFWFILSPTTSTTCYPLDPKSLISVFICSLDHSTRSCSTEAPVRLLSAKTTSCRFTLLPMDTGCRSNTTTAYFLKLAPAVTIRCRPVKL